MSIVAKPLWFGRPLWRLRPAFVGRPQASLHNEAVRIPDGLTIFPDWPCHDAPAPALPDAQVPKALHEELLDLLVRQEGGELPIQGLHLVLGLHRRSAVQARPPAG